jgi:hypothetical protein
MVATAAHLADHVVPPLPVRQCVLSVPKRLRYFLQDDAALQGVVLPILVRAVECCLRAHSPGCSAAARLGAVAFIHRFGSPVRTAAYGKIPRRPRTAGVGRQQHSPRRTSMTGSAATKSFAEP